MSQVFISYTHVSPDRDLAGQLHGVLGTHGLNVFVDSKIRLGQNWVEQVDVQLRASTHFVGLLSAASIKSDMVRREIASAYKLHKANRLVILPVRLDLDEELPYELSAYLDLIQYVVWRPGESFDPICRAILDAIRGPAPLNEPPPKASGPRVFSQSELEAVTPQLARHLGPVAPLVVDQAAKRAGTGSSCTSFWPPKSRPAKNARLFRPGACTEAKLPFDSALEHPHHAHQTAAHSIE